MEELIGKKIRVTSMAVGCCPNDSRWIGHEGTVERVTKSPWGYQIWVSGMSVSLLSESDSWEVIE